MKKLAIFDFDGTLIDSIHDVVKYLNEALSMYDFPTLTSDEYVKYLKRKTPFPSPKALKS